MLSDRREKRRVTRPRLEPLEGRRLLATTVTNTGTLTAGGTTLALTQGTPLTSAPTGGTFTTTPTTFATTPTATVTNTTGTTGVTPSQTNAATNQTSQSTTTNNANGSTTTTNTTTTGTSNTAAPQTGLQIPGAISFTTTPSTAPVKKPPIGPTQFIHTAGGAAYQIAVTGPGFVRAVPSGRNTVAIKLFGTTSSSQVTIVPVLTRVRDTGAILQLSQVDVRTGQLGSFQTNVAVLDGKLSLAGSASNLTFAGLGPDGQIVVAGSLGQLGIGGDATIGPNAGIVVAGGLTNPAQIVGNLTLEGGPLDIAGGLTVGGSLLDASPLNVTSLSVGGDMTTTATVPLNIPGALTVGGTLTVADQLVAASVSTGTALDIAPGAVLASNGQVKVGAELLDLGQLLIGAKTGGLTVGGGLGVANGGLIHVAGDLTNPLTVGSNLVLANGGSITVDRDLSGGVTVGGDMILSTGGALNVGRDLSSLNVSGNVDSSGGGTIQVGGSLNSLAVQGYLRGKGSNDVAIGVNLGNLQVLGSSPNQGGVQSLDLAVGKDILGVDVPHGIFNSLITAGNLIQGGAAGTSSGAASIGPDGPDAVFDSTIMAGLEINNLILGGNVRSDKPSNPAGKPTRIIAGMNRDGTLEPGGLIDNFQITGSLIDSVVAASVGPGKDGTYDQPAGVVETGYYGFGLAPNGTPYIKLVRNDTAPPYNNHPDVTTPGANPYDLPNPNLISAVNYNFAHLPDPTLDPTFDDVVLSTGAINPSFAAPATAFPTPDVIATLPPGSIAIPVPTKPTVLGGVISTTTGDSADYAGIFAAQTNGVFVGK
ncbi:MAG TPA: hypothetical protein VG406_02140, partial [Isosphaeraceae bacterium]|nr:hypothetical protein [Isosphaeraceae bacterium]